MAATYSKVDHKGTVAASPIYTKGELTIGGTNTGLNWSVFADGINWSGFSIGTTSFTNTKDVLDYVSGLLSASGTITNAEYAAKVGTSGTQDTNYVVASDVINVTKWYKATSDPATDTKIDKWFEIENFLNGVTNAQTLTGMLTLYVTLDTTLTITGAKTFSQAINCDILGNATTADRLKNDVAGTNTAGLWNTCKIENGVIKYYDRSNDGNNYHTVTLNGGSATTSGAVSWYAPTTAGTAGLILVSSGGAPNWSKFTVTGTDNTAYNLATIASNASAGAGKVSNVTSHLRVGASGATSNSTSDVSNPYLSLVEGSTLDSEVQISAGDGITITANNGIITIVNSKPDINHNTDHYQTPQVTSTSTALPAFKLGTKGGNETNDMYIYYATSKSPASGTNAITNVKDGIIKGNDGTTGTGWLKAKVYNGDVYYYNTNDNTDTRVKLTTTDGSDVDRYLPFSGTSISSGSALELYYQTSFTYNPGTKVFNVPNITLSNKITASTAEIDSLTTGNFVVQGTSSLGTITSGVWNASKIDKSYLTLNSITAGTAGTSSATSGTSISIPYVTMDAQGLVTGYGTHTHTISLPTGNKAYLTYIGELSRSNNNKSNAATTNGATYMKIFEDNTLENQYLIQGAGTVSVASDASGNITITGSSSIDSTKTLKTKAAPDVAVSTTEWKRACYLTNSGAALSSTNPWLPAGLYGIYIEDRLTSTAEAFNAYSATFTCHGDNVGRLDEIALHSLQSTASDTERPTRIYLSVNAGELKMTTLAPVSGSNDHYLTIKVNRII